MASFALSHHWISLGTKFSPVLRPMIVENIKRVNFSSARFRANFEVTSEEEDLVSPPYGLK